MPTPTTATFAAQMTGSSQRSPSRPQSQSQLLGTWECRLDLSDKTGSRVTQLAAEFNRHGPGLPEDQEKE